VLLKYKERLKLLPLERSWNMTKLSLFKKGIWKTYLISFIIVFLVSSVIIISFFYLLISELFQKEFSQSSLNMANQIRDVMDIRIEELYNLTFQMSMEKSIQNLLYAPAPLSPNSLIMVPDTMKALHGYSSANNFISYLCVYYNNSNSVITLEGKYEADYFFKNVINYEDFTEKEIVKLLKESHNREFTPLRTIKGNNKVNGNYITYIQSLPVGERNPIASIMMFIDEKTLLSMLGEAMKVEEGQLAIYSPKNDTLISHRPDLLRKNKIVEQVKLGSRPFQLMILII
jgi:two-component system, response regulator YesN